jgi:small subunit ribosomal protein S5
MLSRRIGCISSIVFPVRWFSGDHVNRHNNNNNTPRRPGLTQQQKPTPTFKPKTTTLDHKKPIVLTTEKKPQQPSIEKVDFSSSYHGPEKKETESTAIVSENNSLEIFKIWTQKLKQRKKELLLSSELSASREWDYPATVAPRENPVYAYLLARSKTMTQEVLEIRRTVKVREGGKVYSYRACVAVGNEQGEGGIGFGKALQSSKAIEKAYVDAMKHWTRFALHEQRTIFEPMMSDLGVTKIKLRPKSRGYGLRLHEVLTKMSRCFGIIDLSGNVIGRRNRLRIAKGYFEMLVKQSAHRLSSSFQVKNLFKPSLLGPSPLLRT